VHAITAFALYGFPESHASSFALLAYASAWLKVRQPAAFYAALLNNQPDGVLPRRHDREGRPAPWPECQPVDVTRLELGLHGGGAGGAAGSFAMSPGCASRPDAPSWPRAPRVR
jgi:error-prone DNA polymerase